MRMNHYIDFAFIAEEITKLGFKLYNDEIDFKIGELNAEKKGLILIM